jgi:hypothetical protein
MARVNRTAELLAAAGLVPLQIEQEREKGRRAAASSAALASLLPALIQTGAGIAGDVATADMAERKFAADVAARKARTGVDAAKVAADVEKTKAAAEVAKAKAKAEADKAAAAAAAGAGKESREARAGAMTELRSGAASRSLEALIGTASMDDRLGDLDDDAVRAIQAEEQTKAKQAAAELTLAERKAKAPIGPKPKTPEQIARAKKQDEKLDIDIAIGRQTLAGDKPLAPSESERKEQSNVDSMTKNIGKLEQDLDVVVNDGGFGPGFLSGPARNAISKVLGDKAWTDFASTRDAVNLQIFGTLRSDAPSEGENKAAENLKVTDGDTLDAIRSKMATVRALLDAKRRNPGSRLDVLIAGLRGAPAVPVDDIESEADELGITLE